MLKSVWKSFRENRWLLISTLLALSAGLIIGTAMRPDDASQAKPEAEVAKVDRIGLASILPETRIHAQYEFSDCLHAVASDMQTMPHIGQTEKDFLSEYPDGTIVKFTSEEVIIKRKLSGACPRHVLLMADFDGLLHIYQTNPATLDRDCLQSLSLDADAFDPETAEELYQGLVFESVGEVNQYLENMES